MGCYTGANTWGGLGSAPSLKIGEIFQGKRRRRARRLNSLVVRAEEEVFWLLRGNHSHWKLRRSSSVEGEREDFGKEKEGPSTQDREVKRKIGRTAKEFASREKQKGMTS